MKPYRSILILPATSERRAREGVALGADCLVLCLEDLVVPAEKAGARDSVGRLVEALRRDHPKLGLFIRVNPLDSGQTWLDIEAGAVPGLDGLFLSKIDTADDIKRLDILTTEWEHRNGVTPGRLEYIVPGETALCLENAFEICRAPRVATLIGASTTGDIARALGYEWTAEGLESLYYQSRVLLANRAAGIQHPIGGCWLSADDLEGLRRDAAFHRQLGFRGALISHPSHAKVVNEVYTPNAEEIERHRALINAYEEAQRQGLGDFTYEGQFTDIAMVKTARERLDLADAIEALERPAAASA
jgi:citrate lyase subunit beta/citryl-CoA lyase